MEEYNEQTLLNKRNIHALNEGLKTLQQQRERDIEVISSMAATVSDLVQQVQNLTVQVAIMRANAMGHGSS